MDSNELWRRFVDQRGNIDFDGRWPMPIVADRRCGLASISLRTNLSGYPTEIILTIFYEWIEKIELSIQ